MVPAEAVGMICLVVVVATTPLGDLTMQEHPLGGHQPATWSTTRAATILEVVQVG